jgi:hypothetical protein
LAKIALWKILVQLVFRLVQLVFRLVQLVFKNSQPVFGLAQPDTQSVFNLVETGSTGFCTVHFFLPFCCASQKAVRIFLKTGSTGFCAEK